MAPGAPRRRTNTGTHAADLEDTAEMRLIEFSLRGTEWMARPPLKN
jgi:hypothetical protein